MKDAVGYAVEHNPACSHCTGSHNDAAVLGGEPQATGATCHMVPYVGKEKFPLQHLLTVLDDTLRHNDSILVYLVPLIKKSSM